MLISLNAISFKTEYLDYIDLGDAVIILPKQRISVQVYSRDHVDYQLPLSDIWSGYWRISEIMSHPGSKGCVSLILFLYDDNIICGFPYWRSDIAFLQPPSTLTFMNCLSNSRSSPQVYLMSLVSFYVGPSIFFSNDSSNINMKYIKWNVFPSNGSISVCDGDCSFTSF